METVLVTGGAGFIGSHLVHALLDRGYSVRVYDNLSSGRRDNLADVLDDVEIIEADICDREALSRAFKGVGFCFHQAAIPSVPRSIESPWNTNRTNVEGSLNVFLAARSAGARRVVYASSSAVYGNAPTVPITEFHPCDPISPYGVSKLAVELYAKSLASLYEIDLVGLRYFNVFGPRQDPRSQYSAVIPIFLSHMFARRAPSVHGDGLQSRDFSYIDNVVDANLKAMTVPGSLRGVYNVACGQTTTVLELVDILNEILAMDVVPLFAPAREGDIRYSCADISKAGKAFNYHPSVSVREGLEKAVAWFRAEELV